ncbi:hypothetical protein ABZ924_08080 [Streptomyces sp. NPDC046876]|uniref:hypothetical protein n=1 Tax=Streptomyces sp. NPDC046876 TaxID=3155616 RepID=UPI00340BC9CC
MPKRPHLPASTAVPVALTLCLAALATGCGTSAGSHAKEVVAAGAQGAAVSSPAPTAGSPSPPPQGAPSAKPAEPAGGSAPQPSRQAQGAGAQPGASGGGRGEAPRNAAVKPESIEELPSQKAFGWKPDGPLGSRDLHGEKITLNECAVVTGAVLWQQQGYLSSAKNPASQQLFAYPDASAAQAAYGRLIADMDRCQDASRKAQAAGGVTQDASVTATATGQGAKAWQRRWTGVGGTAAGEPQTTHLYAVQRAESLVLFQFDELSERRGPAYDTSGDSQILTALADQATRR